MEKEKEKKVVKQKHRKGLWSPEEDERLRDYILKHGHGCWSSIPINAGLQRNGKSCRLRWINYLRPGLKRGLFTVHEEETILRLHRMLGNKWSQIAQHLPGRTDNEIKNSWHSYLKKKVAKSESNSNNTAESSLSREQLATTQLYAPQKTNPSSLPNVFFAEWLNLDVSNSITKGGIYENQPLFCADSSDIYADMLQDSPARNDLLSGYGGSNGRSGAFEEIISNDIFGNMGEDQMFFGSDLLELSGTCSSSSDFLFI